MTKVGIKYPLVEYIAAGVDDLPCSLTIFMGPFSLYLLVYFFATITGEPCILYQRKEWCWSDLTYAPIINYWKAL